MIYSLRSEALESNAFHKTLWDFLFKIQDKELKFYFLQFMRKRNHFSSPSFDYTFTRTKELL